MNHSTHVGFNIPPPPCGITPISGSVNCLRRWPGFEDPFQSLALGVGISFARAESFCSPRIRRPVPPSPRIASVNDTPGCALLCGVLREPLDRESPAVTVGHRFFRAIVSRLGVPAVLYVVPSPRCPLLVVP